MSSVSNFYFLVHVKSCSESDADSDHGSMDNHPSAVFAEPKTRPAARGRVRPAKRKSVPPSPSGSPLRSAPKYERLSHDPDRDADDEKPCYRVVYENVRGTKQNKMVDLHPVSQMGSLESFRAALTDALGEGGPLSVGYMSKGTQGSLSTNWTGKPMMLYNSSDWARFLRLDALRSEYTPLPVLFAQPCDS